MVNFAVVGTGKIGTRHIECIQYTENASLVATCDLNHEITEGVRHYTTVEELLSNEPSIDVVCICTPNGLHAEQALLALEAKKHVVIEKPMGLKKAHCEKVIHKSLQVHKHVFCVMQNRYSPPSVWLKEMIEEKRLGEIYMVNINCFWNRDDRYYTGKNWHGTKDLDGGCLYTQFSHFVDMMYWLFGDIENIQSNFKDFKHKTSTEFEDSGLIHFDFCEGGMGSFQFTTCVPHQNFESSMTILGEKGIIRVGGQYMEKVELCQVDDYTMPKLRESNTPNNYGEYKGSAANHQFVFDNIMSTLSNQSTISTNALEGLKVVDIIERMYTVG